MDRNDLVGLADNKAYKALEEHFKADVEHVINLLIHKPGMPETERLFQQGRLEVMEFVLRYVESEFVKVQRREIVVAGKIKTQ